MPAMVSSDIPSGRPFTEPQRALLTPSASPSVGPPDHPPTKRPRLRSTPLSTISTTPSTSNESTSSADVNSARRASTLRVLNTWAQLAERYNKRLDEDDIIDLHRYVIVKDRGAVEGASRDYHIGHFTQIDSDQDSPDADQDQDQEDSEQDDDEDELNALPPSETTTDDDAPISKKELLRGVPPLSATTDAEDLREFLEAEKKRREIAGDEEDEEEMPPEQRSALKKELEERLRKKEAMIANRASDMASTEPAPEREVDTTPTRLSTRAPLSGDESEDELALWTHDESTAIYPVSRDKSEQDVHEVERGVIELTGSDSDEEFEAILTHPPRFTRVSSHFVAHPKEVEQLLQSPPNSERGRSKFRAHSHSKGKSAEVVSKAEDRPRSPLIPRRPEVVTHKRKSFVSKDAGVMTFDDRKSDNVGRISPVQKGKGKEIPPRIEDSQRKRTPKSLGVVSRGRKRKRIASSSTSSPLAQSPAELQNTTRCHGKPTFQSSTAFPQPDGSKLALDKETLTSAQFEPVIAGPSRSPSSIPSSSKSQPPILSVPACRSFEPESVQPTSHDHNSKGSLLSDLPIPVTHPYSQRHPSHPPPIFSSPNQGTPSIALATHPSPLMDPVQTQQAHYLLAQAMHQLSFLISATMPAYATYASNPGQPWHHPPPPLLPHTAYSTPIHQPLHIHGTRHYHTPSPSISRSELPPSSPFQSSVSPPVKEQHFRSRARSKSQGRRVSFKLDSEEVITGPEHSIQPELQRGEQKSRKQPFEVKRERGKGKAREGFDDSCIRLEDRGCSPRDITRGRTPGPPCRQKIDVPRGRSLSRR